MYWPWQTTRTSGTTYVSTGSSGRTRSPSARKSPRTHVASEHSEVTDRPFARSVSQTAIEGRSKDLRFGSFLSVGPAVVISFGVFHSMGRIDRIGGRLMQLVKGLRVLANPTRLRVLELLKDPARFDGPRGGDGRPLGVTAKALLKHVRCTQPSLNEQMAILIGVGLVESQRVGRWVVYSRDEERIRQLKQTVIDQL